ncbi:MAG: hypothetical protein WC236_14500 [Gallionellaceae bacterium]|jgi:hypothetical protein
MTNDLPIHLGAASKNVEITLFQSNLDGINALIHFCEGFSASGKGVIPGSIELIMHYRELRSKTNKDA